MLFECMGCRLSSVEAFFDSSSGSFRVRSYKLYPLSELLQQMYASLTPDARAMIEAKDSYPPLVASRVQFPDNQLIPVMYGVLHDREFEKVVFVHPLLVPVGPNMKPELFTPLQSEEETERCFQKLAARV